MPTEFKTLTQLAKELATKELQNDSSIDQHEMIEALDAVAKLLSRRAGANTQIKELANQVQALVKTKNA